MFAGRGRLSYKEEKSSSILGPSTKCERWPTVCYSLGYGPGAGGGVAAVKYPSLPCELAAHHAPDFQG